MERKAFLSMMGLGAGAILTVCMGGCSKATTSYTSNAPTNVNINLDLTLPANAPLNSNGGYIYTNGIIVAKTSSGNFIAVSQECTHQGVSVQFVANTQQFYCPSHGAGFTTTGAVANGPATAPLKQYNTALTNNTLRIFS